eukprot:Tamp_13344.p1 GENE.Tamp_13344~~Tamp_13344.p1  ORF type:complete len:392 (+),score=99.03 Tamp_13344:186-1361(+)
MDDLRENMQLEKLRALKPVADLSDNQGPQRKPGLSSTKQDPKALGKEIQEEVDERVRDGGKGVGEHCDLWMRQAEQVAASQKTQSEFVPTKSNTPLEVYVTVHLKAKNLKRLLTKVGVLADVCLQRSIQGSGNYDVYTDAKGHVKGDFEVKMAPEQMASMRRSANGLGDGGGWALNGLNNAAPGKLPALVPIESSSVKRNKVSNAEEKKKLLQDGSVFQGSLKEGRPHGFGTVTYADTDPKQRVRFAGEFEDGIRTGRGCLVWKDGAQYAGDWFADKPSGFGVENYPDGSSYVGQYEEDMRHGYGTYTFPSGAKYEGCWFMGKRHGQALEQSKKGCHAVAFDNNKRTKQEEFIPGADEEFDMLIAKVRAAVDKVKSNRTRHEQETRTRDAE